MIVHPIPMLEDNYAYLLICEHTHKAAVIDPVEPAKVQQALLDAASDTPITLTHLLTTHKHWDHAGGNKEMHALFPDVPIYGGAIDAVEACTDTLTHNQELKIGEEISVVCLHTPGHTLGHICFVATSSNTHTDTDTHPSTAVFTGDTLFIAGAGKFFEGSPQQMYQSLTHTLAVLPTHTHIYCGHEYTLSNYKFALWLEPENKALIEANQEAEAKRREGKPTVPSTIEQELATNPFLRVSEESVLAKVASESKIPLAELAADPARCLGLVREMKNNFR